MSNFIVLVKQVPDVTQITDNAFDLQTGNLIRSRLASVINQLDTQALAFAYYMRNISSDKNAKIIALTMGPPMADDVLRYCLARCADTAVLLTDRDLGGADTFATANPLSFAIRKIVIEILNGKEDYYIVTGMQSVDGDTAQVPPQVAEELSLPCIAYVTGAEYKDGRFCFTRIVSGGSQVVRPKKQSAVVTVAAYEFPLFAGFAAARRVAGSQIIQWTSRDIGASNIGVQGSKTRVIRVFPPEKTARKCRNVTDIESLVSVIVESASKTGQSEKANEQKQSRYILPGRRENFFDRGFEGIEKDIEDFKILSEKLEQLGVKSARTIDEYTKKQILDIAGEHFHKNALDDMIEGLKLSLPSYKGQVWVVAEHHEGRLHPATFELVGKARQLADSLETQLGVCLATDRVKSMAKELIAAGADIIYLIEDKLLKDFEPAVYRKVVAGCIAEYEPQIVIFAATPQGRMLAPMVSYRIKCGLTADCTGLDIRDSSRKGQIGILFQTRPALGGNVMATIVTKDSNCQMATARPGVMKRLPPQPDRKGKVIKYQADLSEDDLSLEIIKTELGKGSVNFAADVIVSGGRGLQSREIYQQIIGSLCDALEGKLKTTVERGASRAAVEQDFIDRIHQVGQTGTAVGPKLYIALGISGAIQHMIGVSNSQTIIAINNDPNAPIFKQCDYYMIGNVEDIIPKLIQNLQAELHSVTK